MFALGTGSVTEEILSASERIGGPAGSAVAERELSVKNRSPDRTPWYFESKRIESDGATKS